MSPLRAAALALAPGLVGLLASLVWLGVGGAPHYYVTGSMAFVPALLGLAVSVVLGGWLLGRVLETRRGNEVLQAALSEETARHRRLLDRLDHELKNPIQGIRTAIADEPSDRQRASIEIQSRRLTRLMSDLRKVGEVEHTELETGPVDPTALVEEAVDALRELPGTAERKAVVSLPRAPRPLPTITGDDDLLFLAVSNVLSNAVKYSSAGDTVEVRGRADEDWLVLEVADTGRGIPEQEQELVWEELGRGQEARRIEGSGLGLPLVRAIARDGTAATAHWSPGTAKARP
ncbi:sensor histidine kinase [Ornithinimicrobium sp. Y1694]|uniref:sensor histidine kinase n=1 Tax=Ornithinimicrobium sp. Y1694 TaxID=3418590 RepID=UPI003CE82378